MNNLCVIMAHGSAQEIFDRHLPEWEKHGDEILVFCPADNQVKTKHPVLAFGEAQHNGPESIRRFKFLLRFLSGMTYFSFTIFEYDSICLHRDIPSVTNREFKGVRFSEPDIPTWGANRFYHPPLIIGGIAIKLLFSTANKISPELESKSKHFWDRYLGIVQNNSPISLITKDLKWGTEAWSANTIEPQHIPEVVHAVNNGVTWIHGIKTPEVYDAICEARGWRP